MLYISNYDKYNLDKSSQSMYAYYTRLINDINTDVLEIRDYLVNMLDIVAKLRVRLYDIKDSIQEDLDTTKDAYKEAGYTNGALDKVQEILDGAEDDLGGLEQGVQSTINAIDCNQVPDGCSYVEDCADGCADGSDEQEKPVCSYDPSIPGPDILDPDECTYCSYTSEYGEGGTMCTHCDHGECNVNTICNVPAEDKPSSYPGGGTHCDYSVYVDTKCSEQVHINGGCKEETCTYSGQDPCSLYADCTYACTYQGTSCSEAPLPEDCTFSCDDRTECNYDGSCQQCTYSSTYCGESYGCNETCVFDSESCSYNSSGSCSYDSEAGFDYGCNEWKEDCSEPADCSQGSSDDDSNVVCTYIIKRLFNSDSKLLDMSRENVKIGLRNGLNKKAFREYYNGLGLEIIEHLKLETDDYLKSLWLNDIQPVWTLLRTDPKAGVKAYTDFIISQADYYDIDWHKYKNISQVVLD